MKKSAESIFEEFLVLQAQAGDAASMDRLVDQWNPRLLRRALHLTQHREGAQDVVQETWLAIVRGLWQVRDPEAFSGWAYRILSNKCADWIRRRQKQRRLSNTGPDSTAAMTNEPAAAPTVEPARDETTGLLQALRQLPDSQRSILSMHYLEQMSVKEIAAVLSVPVGTVKSRLFNAREKLRHTIEKEHPHE